MSDVTPITDHVERALARLLEQDKGKPRLEALVKIFADRYQRIENVVTQLANNRWVLTAEGVQLDTLGEIVGEPRNGKIDDVYRLWIRARILINRSSGKVSELLRVARIILGDAPDLVYTPEPPAAFQIELTGVSGSGDVARVLFDALNQVRAGGVRMNILYNDDIPTAFTFNIDGTEGVSDAVKGFGDTGNPATGGLFSGLH